MLTCIVTILLTCAQEREDVVIESMLGVMPGASGSLRLSVGGAVEELKKSDPEAAGALVRALGVAAVNVGADDLEAGDAAVRVLAERIPLVSANCALAKPYIVVTAGGRRFGITGVTSGKGVADPAESLARILPALRKESDVVVLMAWMDRTSAAALARKFPDVRLVIHAGAGVMDAEPLRLGESILLRGPCVKWTFGRTALQLGDAVTVSSHRIEQGPSEVPKELMELAGKCGLTSHPLRTAIEKSSGTGDGVSAVPTRLDPAKPTAIGRRVSNRAVRIDVHSVALRAEFGGRKAAAGTRFLLVDTEWENVIPMALVYEKKLPVAYQVPNLGDHLYLVVNGRLLSRMVGEEGPGLIPHALKLERQGDRVRGGILFEVPSDGVETLELRFYDYAHGHATMHLLVRAKEAAPEKPVVPEAANEILECAVYGVRKLERKAPEGMVFIAVDLRARSVLSTLMDDVEIGAVVDWKDAREYVHAVVDGEYAYGPVAGTRLGAAPRFLPEVPTGDLVVFLVPEKRASLELRCDFPNAAMPDGREVHPEAITLLLEGQRPEPPEREAIAEVDDGTIKVSVFGQAVVREFGGEKAGKGKKFLVIDVTVTASESEFFQSKEQLKYGTEKGGEIGVSKVTWSGTKRPTEKVWVPAGGRRSFQLAFEIPETEKKYRLAYAGYTKAETLTLKEGE